MKNLIDNLDEPFSEILLKLIDTKDMTDVAVYKKEPESTEGFLPRSEKVRDISQERRQ